MKKTSKFLAIILAILMVISIVPITASAATYGGACGENVTWELDESVGTLIISGTGSMEDFIYIDEDSSSSAPWFDYKKSIKEIVIADGITTIGDHAFYYCFNLEKVSIPESVTSIGSTAFGMCDNLKTVNIPDSVTTIKNGAFMCSGLTEVLLPKNLTTITEASFRNCPNLLKVTIPDTVTTIEERAFPYCTSLTSITIPKSVTSLGESAFQSCSSLKKVVILANITRIENFTFYDCTKLDELTIPKSVTYSGLSAFANCSNVSDIYYSGTEEEWNNIEFNDLWFFTEPFGGPTMHYNYCLHEYSAVVTMPTCTEQGYTTYTCECGDSYVGDYVDALGHKEETIPAVAPTCTETGLTEGTKCSACGETLTEQTTIPATGHTPASVVEENYVASTCTLNGSVDKVVYCSVCNTELSRITETIEMLGHADNDGNGYCDADNELLDPTVECDCNCHKSGISNFFFKFALFFQRIFGLNKYCECGIVHY